MRWSKSYKKHMYISTFTLFLHIFLPHWNWEFKIFLNFLNDFWVQQNDVTKLQNTAKIFSTLMIPSLLVVGQLHILKMKVHICHVPVLRRSYPGAFKSAETNSILHLICLGSPIADHDPSPAPTHILSRRHVRRPVI